MRFLLWFTVGFTYLLMTWGNLVSATGAGLACPDWPLCRGTVTPPLHWDVVLEWGHRTLAFVTSLLIVSSLISVWRKSKTDQNLTPLKNLGKAIMTLLVIQILLGGITVLLKLSVLVSTIHLATASLVFGGLIYAACYLTWKDQTVQTESPKFRRLVRAGLAAYLLQLVLGAIVRHSHAGLACPDFPYCAPDSFFPSVFYFETALAFIHRWWGVLLLGVIIHLGILVRKQAPALRGPVFALTLLTLGQITLGIITVLSQIAIPVRAIHAATGYLIWGIFFYIGVRSGGLVLRWKSKAIVPPTALPQS